VIYPICAQETSGALSLSVRDRTPERHAREFDSLGGCFGVALGPLDERGSGRVEKGVDWDGRRDGRCDHGLDEVGLVEHGTARDGTARNGTDLKIGR
jgi:hypothetical protein